MLAVFPVLATITEDEQFYNLSLMCNSVYVDSRNFVYQRDKSDLNRISGGLVSELKRKYTENDVNLFLGKSIIEASGMNFDSSKANLVELCRQFSAVMKAGKAKEGRYLSTD